MALRLWFATALGLAALAALMAVGSAGATVFLLTLPNPSFEVGDPMGSSCPPLPSTVICGWNHLVGTMTKDGTEHHTGSYSMKLTDPGTSVNATTANGVCISPISPGPHAASFWYFTSSPVVDVQFGVSWYPNTSCTGSATADPLPLKAATPLTYGAWTQVAGTLTAPVGMGSAFFSLFASCQCSQGPVTAYFDDVSFDNPSAVTLASFSAARVPAGVRVRWRTGTEANTLGFHVYRSRRTGWTRVDPRLIPARDSAAGARYSFLDRAAPRGKVAYRLQVVGTDGSRTWYGRASVVR